ncbi:MAG TPA: hydrogenase iron-sulfur subunit [Desulfobacterales bacterium]|nr:hydrogenase iron-sulfur subunit [Desulfobacterales bacterium]
MNNFEPLIAVFSCHYCSYAAADLAGSSRIQYPPNIRVIKVPCTGRVSSNHILRALECGADGVYVAGCLEGTCHFISGNLKAKQRVQHAKNLLSQINMEPERVQRYFMSAAEGARFANIAKEMTETIRELGPSPLGRNKSE